MTTVARLGFVFFWSLLFVAALTVEAGVANVLEQRLPLGRLHLQTDAGVIGTQVAVHVVQGVRHGVDGVDDELHLALLLVLGVDPDALLAWGVGGKRRWTNSQTTAITTTDTTDTTASQRRPSSPPVILLR